jgi:hypothetical protein
VRHPPRIAAANSSRAGADDSIERLPTVIVVNAFVRHVGFTISEAAHVRARKPQLVCRPARAPACNVSGSKLTLVEASRPTFEQEIAVLRWVHEQGDEGTGVLQYNSTEPSDEVPELTKAQLDETLRRLEHAGLIAGRRIETTQVEWSGLRATADGLRLLGEWPPPDEVGLERGDRVVSVGAF